MRPAMVAAVVCAVAAVVIVASTVMVLATLYDASQTLLELIAQALQSEGSP